MQYGTGTGTGMNKWSVVYVLNTSIGHINIVRSRLMLSSSSESVVPRVLCTENNGSVERYIDNTTAE
jgi:hypothetical protein